MAEGLIPAGFHIVKELLDNNCLFHAVARQTGRPGGQQGIRNLVFDTILEDILPKREYLDVFWDSQAEDVLNIIKKYIPVKQENIQVNPEYQAQQAIIAEEGDNEEHVEKRKKAQKRLSELERENKPDISTTPKEVALLCYAHIIKNTEQWAGMVDMYILAKKLDRTIIVYNPGAQGGFERGANYITPNYLELLRGGEGVTAEIRAEADSMATTLRVVWVDTVHYDSVIRNGAVASPVAQGAKGRAISVKRSHPGAEAYSKKVIDAIVGLLESSERANKDKFIPKHRRTLEDNKEIFKDKTSTLKFIQSRPSFKALEAHYGLGEGAILATVSSLKGGALRRKTRKHK